MNLLRIAFDIGGVISKYPEIFQKLLTQLSFGDYIEDVELYIITDMHPLDKVKETLYINGFAGYFNENRILVADYAKHGEAAKAVLCKEHKIDIFIDDFIGYVADPGATIRLLIMPDSKLPYWSDSWKTTEACDFGRRKYHDDKD